MSTYAIVDLANMYSRARHVIRSGSIEDKIGLSLTITFNSILKSYRDFGADHTVICLEGRSWRKDYYAPYKKNRTVARQQLTEEQQEEDKLLWEALGSFQEFLNSSTNCTVLQHPMLEADDLIAGWIQNYPDDSHIIISTDSDFVQLIDVNVKQYNGVSEQVLDITGYYDLKGKPILEKKTKQHKKVDPKWSLFEKCIRGDSSDNVFSAYPGARKKGTKNRVGLNEAFEDKDKKGYSWNNFMLQRWTDHNGNEHRVLDDYERNRRLIDLTYQPDEIREIIDETVLSVQPKEISQIGAKLMKFCANWNLIKVSDNVMQHVKPLSTSLV